MNTYYINAYTNRTGWAVPTYPYNVPEIGALNFEDLFTAVNDHGGFVDGDTILIYSPATSDSQTQLISDFTVDDSGLTSPLDIEADITISFWNKANTSVLPIVKVPIDVPLFHVTRRTALTTISDIEFHAENKGKNATITLDTAYNCNINDCKFTYNNRTVTPNPVDGFAMWIYSNNTVGLNISGCEFYVLSDSSISSSNYSATAVFIDGSYETDISDCVFHTGGAVSDVGRAIYCNNSKNVRIYRNLVYDLVNPNAKTPSAGSYFAAITASDCQTVDIAENAIRGLPMGHCGIYVNNIVVGSFNGSGELVGSNQMVRNNVIHAKHSPNTACVVNRGNPTVFLQIINNVLAATSGVNTYTIGFDLKLRKTYGVVDYNDIWLLVSENELVSYDGNPDNISEVGSHTLRVSPGITGLVTAWTIYSNYVTRQYSKLIGRGTEYTTIGIDYRRVQMSESKSKFYSVVDTVLHTDDNVLSKIPTYDSGDYFGTYINDTLVMSSAVASANSTKFMNALYDESYQNQFGWDYIESNPFPFTSDSEFYKKNSNYVVAYRKKLWPFSNISCPANPGDGHADGYPNYETGLFGYSRALWENGCGIPCIIQDSYLPVSKQYNSQLEAAQVLNNMIHPECEG